MVKIPVIVGPTASGKSFLAIAIARLMDGEIISCDSRQVYCGMDIGTAKVTTEERSLVPHHCVDIIAPSDEYSAGRWAVDAAAAIEDIIARGKIPIICGGTFFYVRALMDGFDRTAKPDPLFRTEALRREADSSGALYQELEQCNPERAAQLHPNDLYRIIRSLQMVRDGAQEDLTVGSGRDNFAVITIEEDRTVLYNRINSRVDQMVEDGLYSELESLLKQGFDKDSPGLKCVGYQEFFNYIESHCSFTDSVEEIKKHSRKYAKRQLTWLRNSLHADFTTDGQKCRTAAEVALLVEKLCD